MSVITSGQVSHISVSNGGVTQSQELNDYEEENNIQKRNAYDDAQSEKGELIEVSDDEDEEEEEEGDDEEEEEENDSETDDDSEEEDNNNEDESDEENEEEYNDSEIEDLENEDVENQGEPDDDYEPTEESVFKLNNDSNELESLVVEDEVDEDVVGVRDVVDVVDVTEEVEVKPETINLEEQQPSVITQDQKDLFKTISITSLEEDGIRIVETQDYKKMSLPKLKQVAVEKKLVADASKLKKSDIFKLLGVEA